MLEAANRRREERLRYNWPIWFAQNFNAELSQGQMVDVSSGGAAFTCYADNCPFSGQDITARFSVPHYENSKSFDVDNYLRSGYVCRIDEIGPFIRKVAVKFAEPLPVHPGEQKKISKVEEVLV